MSAAGTDHPAPHLRLLRGGSSDLIHRVLGRKELAALTDGPRRLIKDMKVLVTGAGGSIGSELCKQLSQLSPAAMYMLDRDESALHALKLDMTGNATMDTPDLVLADLRDRARLSRVFEQCQPDIVFHAAALKHVPLLELNPTEAWKSNVLGTLNVVELAHRHDVSTLINISTDKAANPVNVLGLSKRVAERITADMALSANRNYMSVRFGNVLGTRGSLLETFLAQIESGGPVTVTDKQMTRFFMTVQEAVRLVLEAGAQQTPGSCMVLDMGDPMSIDALARQLIDWSGKDLEVYYTGLRAGEKLTESLFDESEVPEASAHVAISMVRVPPLPPEVVLGVDPNSSDNEMHSHLARLVRAGTE